MPILPQSYPSQTMLTHWALHSPPARPDQSGSGAESSDCFIGPFFRGEELAEPERVLTKCVSRSQRNTISALLRPMPSWKHPRWHIGTSPMDCTGSLYLGCDWRSNCGVSKSPLCLPSTSPGQRVVSLQGCSAEDHGCKLLMWPCLVTCPLSTFIDFFSCYSKALRPIIWKCRPVIYGWWLSKRGAVHGRSAQ